MWWYHGGWGWGTWLVMTVGMLAFWGLVIWAILALARGPSGGPAPREQTPEQILAERLARGEIDEDEYRRRLAALASHAPAEAGPGGWR